MSCSDSWDHYLHSITRGKFSEVQKDRLMKSVQTFRIHLGEDWPSQSKDTHHELLWSLRVISGATSDYLLVLWGECLSALEKVKGFESMLPKIKDPVLFRSSLAELEVAGRLARHECNLELEPNMEGKCSDKVPDMLCSIGESKFYIEVKTLETADETAKATRTISDIMIACKPIFPWGHVIKPLSVPRLKEITNLLKQEAARAISGKTGVVVRVDKVLNLYLVPDDLPGRVKMGREWHHKQEEAGMMPRGSNGLSGPSDNVKQEYRVKAKIASFAKSRQIPINEAGVLVISGNFLFGGVNDVEKFIDYIIEEIYETSNLHAVVLISRKMFGDAENEDVEKPDFIFIRNQICEGIGEDIVIVKNRFCASKFDYENLRTLLYVNGMDRDGSW